MPSSYTTSLRLTLPATGENAGTWGSLVNTGITELLDAAVAGTTAISTWGGAGVAYTLSNNSGTADEARRMFIVATGTPGEAKNVICPAVSKFYVFRNDTTGGFALTLKTPSGTGIAVPAGQYKFLYCDGTNVVEAFNSAGALTLSGALSVGGTTTLAGNPTLSAGTANGVTYLNASKVLTSGSALTFDGTNLGVGTSSPQSKLHVDGGEYINSAGALPALSASIVSGEIHAGITNTATTDSGYLRLSAGGGTTLGVKAAIDIFRESGGTTGLIGYTNGTERFRVDGSGNFGIGASSPLRKLQVNANQNGLMLSHGLNTSDYSEVTFHCSGITGSGAAIRSYRANNTFTGNEGDLRFYTNPGSATSSDNAIERMRLDDIGNLSMLSPTPALNIGSSNVSTGNCAIEIGVGRTGSGNAYLDLTGDTTYADYGLRIIRNSGGANTPSTIDHRGTGELQFTCQEAAAITFATTGTERARITLAGDFIVGSNIVSGPGAITLASITNGFALVNNNNAAGTGFLFSSFRRSSTEIGSITQNGTTGVLFNTTSDRRLKDNIVPAPSASDVIDAIQIVSHDWKSAPDEHVKYGVIAQDLHVVAPQAVLQGDDGDEIEKTWGVDYSRLVPILIKEIQSLRARVAALEA